MKMDNIVSGIIELHDIEDDDSIKEFPKEDHIKISLDWNKKDEISDRDYSKFYKEKRLQEDITEEERKILEDEVRLDDGFLGQVITCYEKGEEWFYYCHPCVQEVHGWENLKEHVCSEGHRVVLSRAAHARSKFIVVRTNDDLTAEKTDSDLAPCSIQPNLDEYIKPLVGLEYLVESDIGFQGFAKTPQYYCLLCDTLGNNQTIFDHLSSERHYLKYFLMFFPTAFEKLKQFATTHAKIQDIVSAVIQHVAARIETEHGRLKPLQVERDSFDRFKCKILTEIDKGKHIRETKEMTFEECVCLTHLHLSVCPVLSYQEKWIPKVKKEEKAQVEQNKYIAENNPSLLPKSNNIPQVVVPGPSFYKSPAVATFTSQNVAFKNQNFFSFTSTLSSKTGVHIQNYVATVGSLNANKNQQEKYSNLQQIPLQDDATNNRKRETRFSATDNMIKRTKLNEGSSAQTSSQHALPRVWETPKADNFNHIMKNTHVPRFMSLATPNHNRVMSSTNIKITNNIINTSVRPPLPSNVNVSSYNARMNQAIRILTGGSNNLDSRVQLPKSNQGSNISPWINQQQNQFTSSTSFQTKTNTNMQNFNTSMLNNQTQVKMMQSHLNTTNLVSNVQNTSNTVQNSLNSYTANSQKNQSIFFHQPNVRNTALFGQSQPNPNTVTASFNSSQTITTIPPPFMNNSGNVQQLNPIAFSVPPPIMPSLMTVRPPPISFQRLNLPTSNQFNQQTNNFNKF